MILKQGRQYSLERIGNTLGVLGLYLSAFGLATSKAAQNSGAFLMLVGIILTWRHAWPNLRSSALLWLCAAWILYCFISAGVSAARAPEFADKHWGEAVDMIRLLHIPLFAWWYGANLNRLRNAFLFAMGGLLLAILLHMNWAEVPAVLLGEAFPVRNGFGDSPVRFGIYCVLALAGLALFSKEWLRTNGYAYLFLLIPLAALIALALFFTLTRAAWLILIILIALASGYFAARTFRRPRSLLILTIIVLCGSGIAYSQKDVIQKRVVNEVQVVAEFIETRELPADLSSMGVRFHLWSLALQSIRERPLFGWGPAGEYQLIKSASDIPAEIQKHYHFHNSFIGVVVRAGLVGSVFFLAAIVLVGTATFKAWRAGRLEGSVALYLVVAFFVFMTANLTDNYFDRQHGWFIAALLGGAGYTFHINRKILQTESDPDDSRN